MHKEKAQLYERVTHQCFHNPEWKKFLDSLPTQHDKDVAGKTMDWVKSMYRDVLQSHYNFIQQLLDKEQGLIQGFSNTITQWLSGKEQELIQGLSGKLIWKHIEGKLREK